MEIKFCDTCGKKTEKLHGVAVLVGVEKIVKTGMSDYCQHIDGKMAPVMGRRDIHNVCIDCLVVIETASIDDLKEKNKDRIVKSIKYLKELE